MMELLDARIQEPFSEDGLKARHAQSGRRGGYVSQCDCSFITNVNMVNFLLKLFYSSLIFNHDIKWISPLSELLVFSSGNKWKICYE